MPSPFRGTPKSDGVTNGGNVVLTFDVGADAPQEGDVVIFYGGRGNNTNSDPNAWGPVTSGYEAVETLQPAVPNTLCPKWGLWKKVMGATPDLTVEGAGGGGTNQGAAYSCYVLDKSLIDAAIFDAVAVNTGEVTQVPDGPAITTQTAGAWVITHAAVNNIDDTRGTVANYTIIPGAIGNDNQDCNIEAAWREIAEPGTEDPPAWSTWDSAVGGAITIAIKPVTEGGGGGEGGAASVRHRAVQAFGMGGF
ncbi:MAG: hypothetical protein ACREMZ_15655 [Gemmatimonadales bacterium]